MTIHTRRLIPFLCFMMLAASARLASADGPAVTLPDVPLGGGQVLLPNGWKVSPAGKHVQLPGDMPQSMLLTPDHKYLLVSTGGYNEHGVSVLNSVTGDIVDHATVPQTFAGMCTDPSGQHVRLSTGGITSGPTLYSFALQNGHLNAEPGVVVAEIPKSKQYIGGLACDSQGTTYIANINGDSVYRAPANGAAAIAAKVGYRPCAIALSPDQATLAVANWGDASVSLLNCADLKERAKVTVGNHPIALAWARDGRLFVANSGGDTVSVIDPQTLKATESIRTSLDFQVPVGSTPAALAVDPVMSRLYVANADNNDVAVVDIAEAGNSKVLGFIPTGWYPCALAVSGDGKTIFVGTGKGLTFGSNKVTKVHIAKLLTGHVSLVAAPDPAALAGYTRQVLANTPIPQGSSDLSARDQQVVADAFAKIKHVIYVIKENRTYDQVFGDLPQGNGDSSLTMFGQAITPNQHALAQQWVLMDNLYCNGEVSVDGHAWCDAAYTSNFTERKWTNTYSKRPGVEGDSRIARSPGGYIWDTAVAHHLVFRTYGEGAEFIATPDMAPDVDDTKIRDEFLCKKWKGGLSGPRDFNRINVFIDELHDAEHTGKLPNLMVMSLPEDHTYGLAANHLAPKAMVASNDQGVGKLVDAVTHSSFWPETAIFIIEDDAQNGQDHVDAHRTVGLVISPYTRRGFVDHTMYTNASMVRTIELILKLPPMTQYDAAATPMFNTFDTKPDLRPYVLVRPQTDLLAMNPRKGKGATASAALDFSDVDRADADTLNAILWDDFKPGTLMPAPVRSMIFVR